MFHACIWDSTTGSFQELYLLVFVLAFWNRISYFARSSGLFVLNPETNILPLPVNKIIVAIIAIATITHIIQINHIIKTPFNP